MLKTRITEQYGLKVPFINAGMAFIATTPLVRSVCKAGGWECWALRLCLPTCCKRRSARSKQQASMLRGQFHCAVQRHRTHRGMRQRKGAGCRVLLG